MRQKELLLSETLANFLNFIDSAAKDYDWHFNNVGEKDKEHQDFIHSLELDGLKYKERAKLATKMQISRRERRDSKNAVELLAPICECLKEEANKKAINRLQQVMGEIRKRENRLNNRVYRKRAGDLK